MSRVVTLADLRPSKRADEKPWIEARIDEADELEDDGEPLGEEEDPFEVEWTELQTIALDELDEDPLKPRLRTLTVDGISGNWLRVVFLDEDGNADQASPYLAVEGPQYRPLVKDVAGILWPRTRVGGSSLTPSGTVVGTFNQNTSPTREQAIGLIETALDEVAGDVGVSMPGDLVRLARRVTCLRTASEIERTYLPEASEARSSSYQTLRMTYEDEAKKLRTSVQWAVLAARLERRELERERD